LLRGIARGDAGPNFIDSAYEQRNRRGNSFLAANTTAAPSSASFNATDRPIPRLAPVTMATLADKV
jgi:hypothetical protein